MLNMKSLRQDFQCHVVIEIYEIVDKYFCLASLPLVETPASCVHKVFIGLGARREIVHLREF